MKLKFVIAMVASMTVATSFGAIGVVESTGQFTVNSSTIFRSPIPGSTSNLGLNGYDFGTFDPSVGDSLTLTNWYLENYAYNSGGTGTFDNNWVTNGNSATLILSIDSVSNNQPLAYLSSSGNNHFWSNSPDSVNLLTGLSNGSHTLSVSISYTFNQWDGSQTIVNTSTVNGPATATFTVVPEPASAALGLLGALLILRRRR
jgi:MYXO-CTERM domain-containing protein